MQRKVGNLSMTSSRVFSLIFRVSFLLISEQGADSAASAPMLLLDCAVFHQEAKSGR
jgi:hypothetical protein